MRFQRVARLGAGAALAAWLCWSQLAVAGPELTCPINSVEGEHPICQLMNSTDDMVSALAAQAHATANACLNGAPGCPAPIPPTPSADPVYDAISNALSIAIACLNGAPECPASPPKPPEPPDTAPIFTLVAQVYAAADACQRGAPDCPAPRPPSPDTDPVFAAVSQAVAIAQACANGAPGCPAPVPPLPSEVSGGLGGYRMCTTTGLVLDGHLSSVVIPGQSTTNRMSVSGSGFCTKDGNAWVDVTFSFVGTEQTLLSCASSPGSPSYVLEGSFRINDGIANPQTNTTLTITATYVDAWTRNMTADFDLPDVEMRSAFHVFEVYPPFRSADPAVCVGSQCPVGTPAAQTPDIGSVNQYPAPPIATTAFWVQFGVDPSVDPELLLSSACYRPTVERLQMAGTLDVVQPIAVVTAEALAIAGDEFVDLREELGIDDMAPIELVSDVTGIPITEEVAQAFPEFMEMISDAFGSSLAPALPSLDDTNGLPYNIIVKYKTATGSQTIQTAGVSGLKTPLQVPNVNNSNIPELVHFLVTVTPIPETTKTRYSLSIERATSGSIVLPIDASVAYPPIDSLEQTTGFAAQLGFEGFSVSGGAPKRFALDITLDSQTDDLSTKVTIDRAQAPAALDVVGKYRIASEQTDLALRMHMPTPATNLSITSSKTGSKRVIIYGADITVPSITITGLRAGREFVLGLTGVAPTMTFCSDSGNGCVLPWRVYKCGSKSCPIPAESSVSFSSRNAAGGYQETTLNLKSHSPKLDESGNVVSDTVTTVKNFRTSQFAYDNWKDTYPQRFYLDSRDRDVDLGELRVDKYNEKGERTKSFAAKGWFRATGRSIIIKKHKVKVFGKTLFRYYTVHQKGKMVCNEQFHLTSDGKFPYWLERIISQIICWCFWNPCLAWPG
jgi:hypothetical protein